MVRSYKRNWQRTLVAALIGALILQSVPVAGYTSITRQSNPLSAESGVEPSVELWSPLKSLPISVGPQLAYAQGTTTTLSLSKAGPSEVDQGGVIGYRLTLTNTGTVSESIRVVVTDTIPSDTTLLTAGFSDGGGTYWLNDSGFGGDVNWYSGDHINGPSLGPGLSATLVMSVTVDSGLPNGTVITNPMSAYSTSASNADWVQGSNTVTTVVRSPEWQINKSVVPTPTVDAGELLTYTLRFTNTGSSATSGSTYVVDNIPDNTSFASASGSYVQAGDTITWTVTDPLGPNESVTTTMVVTVSSPLTNGLTITNSGYRVFGGGVYTGAIGPPVVSTVRSQSQLQAGKVADPSSSVAAGEQITYTLTITNLAAANGPAQTVIITDSLPSNVVYEATGFVSPATGTVSNPGFGTNGDVTWTLTNTIFPDDISQVYVVGRVISPLPNGTEIVNTCTVSATNAVALATCSPYTNTVTSTPSLSLGKSVTPSVNVTPGGTVTYTLVISNTGNETATGVAVTDTLEAGFSPGVVTWTNVTVPGRSTYGTVSTITRVFTATVPVAPGTYYNRAITATYTGTTVTAADLAPVTVGTPDLRISKSAALTQVVAGDPITFTIVYSNASDAQATGVRITDTLDSNLIFVSASPSPDEIQSPDYGWDVGTLRQSDGERTIVITATVTSDTSNGVVVRNSASVTSTQMVGASDEVTATVLAPVLQVLKSDVGYDPIDAGAVLTYTITYFNSGDAPAHNVRITDTLDSNVTFAWASGSLLSTSPVVLDEGDVPAQSGLLAHTIAVTVTSPLTDGTALTNSVVIRGSELTSDSDSITTTVRSAPVLQVSKSASPGTVRPGEPLTYTIVFTNEGNAVATGVRITDTLDSNVTLQSTDPVSSGVIGNQVYWIWPSPLVPDDPQTITVTVAVTSPLAGGTILQNGVDVGSSQGVTDTYTLNTPVESAAELHISKTAIPATVQPGDTITYTIAYSNSGASPADVVIIDTLDSNVNFVSATPSPVGSPPPYTWTVTGLSPLSGTQLLTVVVTAGPVLTDGMSLVNTVVITGDGISDADSATTAVESLDLSIAESADPASDVQANEWITYTIAFSNAGSMDASNVRITDTLPASLTNVISSTSGGISFVGGAPPYAWDAGTLNSGGTGTITITGQLSQSPWPSTGSWLVNTVVITSDQAEAIISNNTASVPNLGLPGDPYTVTLTAVPTITTVGNVVPITATVTDQWGNPVRDGLTVDFDTSFGTLLPGSDTTQDGVATSTIASTLPGVASITGTINSRTDSISVTFNIGAPHHFVFTPTVASPQTVGVPFSLTVVAVDQYGNTVPTYTTSANLADTTGVMQPTSTGASWVGGVWTGTVSITQAIRNNAITATQGVISGTSNLFDVRPGPADSVVLTVTTPMSPCGATSVHTATVRDSYDNLLWAGTPITFYLVDLGATGAGLVPAATPYVRSTDDSGIATATVQSASATGLVRLEVDVDGDFITDDADLINITGVGIATNMQLTASPSTILTGGTSAITVTLRDCASQAVPGASVDVMVSGLGSLSPASGTSNTSGVFTSTFTAGLSGGTAVVTATGGALSESTPITITGGPVFTLTKTSVPAPGTTISPTDTITYYIVVTNTGTDSSGFVLTDTIPSNSQYVSGSASTNGNIVSLTPDLVITRSMTSGAVLTATFAVTSTGGGSINNQATIFSDQTGQQTSSTVSHRLGGAGGLYLPIVMKAWDGTTPPTPTDVNLVVDRIEFAGTAPVNPGDLYHVRVVVRNAGTQTLTTDFWVDLYLNPVSTPAPNQPWQTLSQSGEQGVSNCATDDTCYGRAWFVTADLAPGEAITLTTSQATDDRYDRWPSAGAPYHSRHTPIVALVDSWSSLGNSYGAIYESNEGDNLSGSLTVTGMAGNQLILDLPPGSTSPAGGRRPTLPGVSE